MKLEFQKDRREGEINKKMFEEIMANLFPNQIRTIYVQMQMS